MRAIFLEKHLRQPSCQAKNPRKALYTSSGKAFFFFGKGCPAAPSMPFFSEKTARTVLSEMYFKMHNYSRPHLIPYLEIRFHPTSILEHISKYIAIRISSQYHFSKYTSTRDSSHTIS